MGGLVSPGRVGADDVGTFVGLLEGAPVGLLVVGRTVGWELG